MVLPSSSSSSSSSLFLSPTRFTKEEPTSLTDQEVFQVGDLELFSSPKRQKTIRKYSRAFNKSSSAFHHKSNQLNSSPTKPVRQVELVHKVDSDSRSDQEYNYTNKLKSVKGIKKKVEFNLPTGKNEELNNYFIEPEPELELDTRPTDEFSASQQLITVDESSNSNMLNTDIFAIFNLLDESSPIKASKLPVLRTASFTKENSKVNKDDITLPYNPLNICDALQRESTKKCDKEVDRLQLRLDSFTEEENLDPTQEVVVSNMKTYSQSRSYISDPVSNTTRLSQESSSSSSLSSSDDTENDDNDEEHDHLANTILTSDDNIIMSSYKNHHNNRFGFVGIHNGDNNDDNNNNINNENNKSVFDLRAKSSIDEFMFYLDPFFNKDKLSIRRAAILDLLIKIEIDKDVSYMKFVENDIDFMIIDKILNGVYDDEQTHDMILSICFISLLDLIIKSPNNPNTIQKKSIQRLLLQKEEFTMMLINLIKNDKFENSTFYNLSRFDRLKFNKWLSIKKEDKPCLIALKFITNLIQFIKINNLNDKILFSNFEFIDLIHKKFVNSLHDNTCNKETLHYYFNIIEVSIDEFSRDQTISLISSFKDILNEELHLDEYYKYKSFIMILLLIKTEDILFDQMDKQSINNLTLLLRSTIQNTENELSLLIMALLISFKSIMKEKKINTISLIDLISEEDSNDDIYTQGYLCLLISSSSLSLSKLKKINNGETSKRIITKLEKFINELMTNLNDFNTRMIDTLNTEIQKLN